MNVAQSRQGAHEEPLRITLEGPPALITRILRGIDAALSGDSAAPEKLFLTRTEAAALLNMHEDRISALVVNVTFATPMEANTITEEMAQ